MLGNSAAQSVNGAFVLEEIGATTPAAAENSLSEIGKERQVRDSLDFRSGPEPKERWVASKIILARRNTENVAAG